MKLKEKAKIIIDNHLYVNGWLMKDYCEKVLNGEYSKGDIDIDIYELKGEYVGSFIRIKGKTIKKLIMVYVKPKYRRNGIGSKLLERNNKKGDKAMIGVKGSEHFWDQHDIGNIL